ncbi:MAG: hypothetical protein AB1744_10145 [Candidatus Zixiibacteriota bacterium]
MSELAEVLRNALAGLEALQRAEPLAEEAALVAKLEVLRASEAYRNAKQELSEAQAIVAAVLGRSTSTATRPERATTAYTDYTSVVAFVDGRIRGKINGHEYETAYPLPKGEVNKTAERLLMEHGGGQPTRGQVGALTQAWHRAWRQAMQGKQA